MDMKTDQQMLADVRAAGREMWGQVDGATPVVGVPGVYFVSTSGHGGYVVDLEDHPLPDALTGWDVIVTIPGSGSRLAAFEEDCDYAALLYFDEVVRSAEESSAHGEYKEQYACERLRTLVGLHHPEMLTLGV